jgi:uncharacterized protein
VTEHGVALVAGLLLAVMTTPVGISGAVLLIPVQLSVLGVPSPSVTPTNLLFNVVAVPGSLARFAGRGQLTSGLTGRLLVGAVPGMILGAALRVLVLPDGSVFRTLVAILLAVLGTWLLARAPLRETRSDQTGRAAAVPLPAWVVPLGFGAGVVGGVYGVGGGSLLAPVLVAAGFTPFLVAPAALATTLLTSVVGVLAFVALSLSGHPSAAPDWSLGFALGLGGLVGGWLGAGLQDRVPTTLLVRVLGLLCLVVAASYLARG